MLSICVDYSRFSDTQHRLSRHSIGCTARLSCAHTLCAVLTQKNRRTRNCNRHVICLCIIFSQKSLPELIQSFGDAAQVQNQIAGMVIVSIANDCMPVGIRCKISSGSNLREHAVHVCICGSIDLIYAPRRYAHPTYTWCCMYTDKYALMYAYAYVFSWVYI